MGDAGTQADEVPAASAGIADGAFIDTGEHTVIAKNRPLLSRCFKQKPLQVVYAEESEGVLERTLGFWDLFALGFGGTVGSGVFVMAGLICHEIAGPAGMLSWVIAGVGCLLSGMSFAELSWRVPSAGGAYAYAFVALGELPAAVVGWCMTLEYGISGAAVARSWGEMLRVGLLHSSADGGDAEEGSDNGDSLSFLGAVLDMGGVYAALLQGACVLVVVGGLEASKYTVNTFCVAKALLVAFMCTTAFSLWNADNFVPLAPFGASGVLKGGVAAFFGFLGFDEVVLLSPEAKNPSKHVPRALFASLLGVTLVCATASVALSGAEAAPDLDPDSAFAEAFRHRGMTTAYKITAIGELVTLPLVVLVSFMAQPRLLFAMAKDGLLPRLFAEVDSRGTLLKGSLVSGAVCMLTALVVPFECLNTIISAGVLLAFNFVTSSQLVLRHRACHEASPSIAHADDANSAMSNSSSINRPLPKHSIGDEDQHGRDGILRVFIANLTACASAGVTLAAGNSGGGTGSAVLTVVASTLGAATFFVLSKLKSHSTTDNSSGNYLSPFFPWPQALALWVNWFLVCQLPAGGLLALLTYVAFAGTHYAAYGASRSVGNCTGWSLLLSSAPSSRSPDGSECLTLSADALENAFMVGNSPTECSSPTAEQPLMTRDGSHGGRMTARPGGESGGDDSRNGGAPDPSAQPLVAPITTLQQPTPAAKPSHDDQHMLFRRRSMDAHSFRSPT